MLENKPYGCIGWLQKACRFHLLHHHAFKPRYFVLLNTELRYYKHPNDINPAGVIELKSCQYIIQVQHQQQQDSPIFYGFRIVSEVKNQCQTLYTTAAHTRQCWVDKIQENIDNLRLTSKKLPSCNRIADMDEATCSSFSFDSVSPKYTSVLDKWLDILDLNDHKKAADDDTNSVRRSNISLSESCTSHTSRETEHRKQGSICSKIRTLISTNFAANKLDLRSKIKSTPPLLSTNTSTASSLCSDDLSVTNTISDKNGLLVKTERHEYAKHIQRSTNSLFNKDYIPLVNELNRTL